MDFLLTTFKGLMQFWGVAWVIAFFAVIFLFVGAIIFMRFYFKMEDLYLDYLKLNIQYDRLRKKNKSKGKKK